MLPEIRISSPCTADWDKMQGDDRIRYCEECRLNVYNFSVMTPAEVKRLVSNRDGRLCARFYRRSDGTMLTQNCPVGLRVVVRRISRVAGAALTAMMSVGSTAAQKVPDAPRLVQIKPSQTGISLTVMDQTGAVIPRATISVSKDGTAFKIEGVTTSVGSFERYDLSPGSYTIKIQAPGFEETSLARQLKRGEVFDSNVQLELSYAIMGEVVDGQILDVEPAEANIVPDLLSSNTPSNPKTGLGLGPRSTPHRNPISRLIHKLGF